MTNQKIKIEIAGKPLEIELKKWGRQADGSALIRYGDTVMFVSACSKKEAQEGRSFLPLIVDYRENTYASGKIPGGFFKREGRPSEAEILISRLIDRPIRSLFPDDYYYETQIVALLLSADIENEPDALGLIGASAALYFSDIPFTTPIGAVKVGFIDGQLVINPPKSKIDECPLEMIVVGTEEGIVVIEAEAQEIDEETVVKACEAAQEPIKQIIQAQKDLYQRLQIKKRDYDAHEINQDVVKKVEQIITPMLPNVIFTADQTERREKNKALEEAVFAEIPEENEDERKQSKEIIDTLLKKKVREIILNEHKRPDGRGLDDIRDIRIEVGMLPRTHGSAIFTRGETQALSTVTLGTFEDTQTIDALGEESEKRFMLHYNFPPFSVGEVQFLRGPGRREIGHGALAEKSIRRVIPDDEGEFPYTIRCVCDILESNGSSSMASVCGGVLALMDAGVPLSMTIAGISVGLITENERYSLLSDIAGYEDHFGDMDLKVAGSENGITAIQMDLKVPSIPLEILREGLIKARDARLKVLAKMKEALPESRPEISIYAPRIVNVFINPEKVGAVIGPSGKVIKGIVAETGVKIDVEEDGKITIASSDMEAVKKAEQMIKDITEEAEVGKIYEGKVVRLEDYGAFIQILPNADGLLHISEISHEHTRNIRDVLKLGQTVKVKVISIDDNNRIRLSKKAIERGTSGSRGNPPYDKKADHRPDRRQDRSWPDKKNSRNGRRPDKGSFQKNRY
jgi:polyribonucleotide nucleotidyltransferase